MPKKGGKKGKKGPALVTDAASLAPFNVNVRDIIATPLGVETTVVGVKDGALMVMWPGGLVTVSWVSWWIHSLIRSAPTRISTRISTRETRQEMSRGHSV